MKVGIHKPAETACYAPIIDDNESIDINVGENCASF